MPKLASIIYRLTHHDLPELASRLLRLNTFGMMVVPCIDIRPCEPRMEQAYDNAFLLEIHSHALPYAVHCCLAGPICIAAASRVVTNAADPARHNAYYTTRLREEIG